MANGRTVGLGLMAFGALALVVIFLGTGSKPAKSGFEPSPSPSQSHFRSCKATVSALPAGFVLRDRSTRNLGSGVMGQSVTYGGGGRSVQVHIGFDGLDAADDLDFEIIGEALIGRREVEVLVAQSLPTILAATWEEPGLVPPCNEMTVMSRGFSQDELLVVVGDVKTVASRAR